MKLLRDILLVTALLMWVSIVFGLAFASLEALEVADLIDVTADHVAAEGIAGAQAGLQIDVRADLQLAQRGFRQGLARHVCKENRALDAGHGEAHALDADAVADGDARHIESCGIYTQLQITLALRQRDDAALCQDDSSKHNYDFFGLRMMRISSPNGCTSRNSNDGSQPPPD